MTSNLTLSRSSHIYMYLYRKLLSYHYLKSIAHRALQKERELPFLLTAPASSHCYHIGSMPQTPKRPSEEPHRTGSEKKLVQTKLSFAPKSAPRFVPRPISPSSSLSSSVSSSPSSSRFFSNSAPSNSSNYRRPGPAGRGLFKNRQWVREDSAGSSSLLGLSLSDKDKRGVRGLDGEEETPRKPKPFGARYNEERVAVAKETM